jgi:hypothetical protein
MSEWAKIADRLANNKDKLRTAQRKLKGAMRCKQTDLVRKYRQQVTLLERFVATDSELNDSLEQEHQRRMESIQSAVAAVIPQGELVSS